MSGWGMSPTSSNIFLRTRVDFPILSFDRGLDPSLRNCQFPRLRDVVSQPSCDRSRHPVRRGFIIHKMKPRDREKMREYQRAYVRRHARRVKKRMRLYHKTHKEKLKKQARAWYIKNRRACIARTRRRYFKHRAELREQAKVRDRNRRKTDDNYRIQRQLRNRIKEALKHSGAQKSAVTIRLLGCGIPHCKRHLEKLFLPGMTWGNRSRWHIDHKRPCASFDLTHPAQQRRCFHYTNLQPLWKKANLKKGAKWKKPLRPARKI